jgi:hypothetical protein
LDDFGLRKFRKNSEKNHPFSCGGQCSVNEPQHLAIASKLNFTGVCVLHRETFILRLTESDPVNEGMENQLLPTLSIYVRVVRTGEESRFHSLNELLQFLESFKAQYRGDAAPPSGGDKT